MSAPDILNTLQVRLAPQALEFSSASDMTVAVVSAENLLIVVRELRNDFQFDLFLDVTAVDWTPRTPRFDVVYHFYSSRHHLRCRLKVRVSEAEPTVDSLLPLYGSAAFMERECHEMYGIVFRGNADLRPILLYEGFTGHPLRKDYPKTLEQPIVAYRTP